MNIERNSWHFKLLKKLDYRVVDSLQGYGGKTVTLCQYFWNVVAALIHSVGIGLSVTLALSFLGMLLGTMLLGVVLFIGAAWLPTIPYNYVTLGEIGVGLSGFIFFGFVIETAKVQIRNGEIIPQWMKHSKPKAASKKNTKPNILFEFIKAKKNKFCPVVKLED